MPALPPVAKVIRVDLRITYGAAARVMDRIFFQFSGAMSATDLVTVLTTIRNAWNTNMAPLLIQGTTLNSVTGTDLSSSTGAQAQNSTASAGTVVDNPLPADSALIIKFKIARRYRGGHPRFYLVGRGVASVGTTQQWTAATLSGVLTGWQNFIAACVLAPPAAVGVLSHVNVSYFSGFHNVTLPSGRQRALPTLRGTPLVDAVQSYATNPIFGSQRRRAGQSP